MREDYTQTELDAAFNAGCEDGEFTPERWRLAARLIYLEAWNRSRPEDQRTLEDVR